jgi:hypothetical protein
MDTTLSGPLKLNDLLHFKAIGSLSETAKAELTRIERLDTTGFSEAEVRAYVIDPIVRILGYEKGSIFSVDLEKKIDFLEKDKFIDYKMTLWKENFWLIEAKRPRPNKLAFEYRDLAQALEYAVHPEVNAALVVLCDGEKFEVFDREVSITEPILRIYRSKLSADFDKLRILLEPWQIWFFQKRRIVRLIDKVFSKEFNLTRVSEFKFLIEQRLDIKRAVILENFRDQISLGDASDKFKEYLNTADPAELIDVHFFLRCSGGEDQVMIDSLVREARTSSFRPLSRIFPDQPRDTNDLFYMHALWFLMALHGEGISTQWLPTWLSGSRALEPAIERLIQLTLTSFATDEARKVIALAASAIRRILKLLSISREDQWRAGQILHAVERFFEPELSWGQIVASPARQILLWLDKTTLLTASRFVRDCQDENRKFLTNSGRNRLTDLWNIEKTLLAGIPNYLQLRSERDLGEIFPTEACNVVYDCLGHNCLCAINLFTCWKEFTMANHHTEVDKLAALGSWQAKELLGLEVGADLPKLDDQAMADRFFFGDVGTFLTLRAAYGYR